MGVPLLESGLAYPAPDRVEVHRPMMEGFVPRGEAVVELVGGYFDGERILVRLPLPGGIIKLGPAPLGSSPVMGEPWRYMFVGRGVDGAPRYRLDRG